MQAILTSDIVNSTQLPNDRYEHLKFIISRILEGNKLEFYRGDSFQCLVEDGSDAFRLALLCRTYAISLTTDELERYDIRISIGLDQSEEPVHQLASARSQAFLLSDRAFDELEESGKKLVIVSPDPLANAGFDVLSDYVNEVFEGLTGRQAAVIHELLKQQTLEAVSKKLEKSKSTVHQHAQSGRWKEIDTIIAHYQKILSLLTNQAAFV